jgi:hypothetical protein
MRGGRRSPFGFPSYSYSYSYSTESPEPEPEYEPEYEYEHEYEHEYEYEYEYEESEVDTISTLLRRGNIPGRRSNTIAAMAGNRYDLGGSLPPPDRTE